MNRCAVTLLLLLLATAAGAETLLVPRLSVWRYASGADLGTAWTAPAYDDSGWPAGPGVLGYGDPGLGTTVPFGPDPNDKHPTCYFRTEFTYYGDPAEIQGFVLRADYDDGFAAYLNGQELARNLVAPGAPYADYATALHEAGTYETFDVLDRLGALAIGTNTLAVEVHQRTGDSSDLAMDMELAFSTAIEVVRGPYLQVGTPTSGIVRWRTNTATDSRVRYGPAPGVWVGTVADIAVTTEHEIALIGLQPDTRYHYDVGNAAGPLAGGSVDHFFVTSPPPGARKPTRVWLLGDSGTANANAEAVRRAYEQFTGGRPTDLWIMLGDNAYLTGTDAEYQAAVFAMYPRFLQQCFLWPTRGNHDALHAGANNDYYEIFTLPTGDEAGGLASGNEAYYSFDYGEIHFVCLDSEGSNRTPGGAMLTWLEADLAATTRRWIIAFWHHPPYTKGSHDSDNVADSGGRMRDMRENALPILEAGGVDAVFCGHSHSYERSFLLDGHYDVSTTLVPGMIVDGSGGPYRKADGGPQPHAGAVYVVAGSSGQVQTGPLNHPVMVHASLNVLGSVVMDIDGNQLQARFIDVTGAVRDQFAITKEPASAVPGRGSALTLAEGYPNPASSSTRLAFALPTDAPALLAIYDVRGRLVRTLADGPIPAGNHEVTWTGTDALGRPVARGLYFAVLESGGERRVRKVTMIR